MAEQSIVSDYHVADLIDQALEEAKDVNFSRTRALYYMQRTQDQVLGRYRLKFTEDSLVETLSTGSTNYSYDCEHQEIIQIVFSHADLSSPSILTYLPSAEFFERFPDPETGTAGLPTYYTDFGDQLYFDVPLDKGYSIGMRYITASHRLEDDEDCTPDLPQSFSDIYIKGALAGIEQSRENFDIAAVYKREIEDLTEDLVNRYSLRKMQPGKVGTTRRRTTAW